MARRRAPQAWHGPHTDGHFTAERDPETHHRWVVVVQRRLYATIHTRRQRADAERTAAALNAVRLIPTAILSENVLTRLCLTLERMTDLVEGVPVPGIPDAEAYRAVLAHEARDLLRVCGHVGPPQAPAQEEEPAPEATQEGQVPDDPEAEAHGE